jgi:hypothetical protein
MTSSLRHSAVRAAPPPPCRTANRGFRGFVRGSTFGCITIERAIAACGAVRPKAGRTMVHPVREAGLPACHGTLSRRSRAASCQHHGSSTFSVPSCADRVEGLEHEANDFLARGASSLSPSPDTSGHRASSARTSACQQGQDVQQGGLAGPRQADTPAPAAASGDVPGAVVWVPDRKCDTSLEAMIGAIGRSAVR